MNIHQRAIVSLLCGVSALTMAGAVQAQTADVEEVVVTGSRTIQNGNNSPTPVTVVSVAELQTTRPTTIAEGLNDLPVFSGSRGNNTPGNATANGSGNFLSLRGFGASRTLILQDGRRVPATSASGQVDTNTLPGMLVQRVDVVTGGASAVYGSDAVTGVVNFILNKNFNGIAVEGSGGLAEVGDSGQYRFGVAAGRGFFDGKLHLEGSYEHFDSNGIQQKFARPIGRKSYCTVGAGTQANPFYTIENCRNNSSSFGGLIRTGPLKDMEFASNGVLTPFVHGIRTTTPTAESGGNGIYQINTPVTAWQKTDQMFARADLAVNDAVNVFAQLSGSKNLNGNVFNAASFNGIVFSSRNAFLSPAIQAAASAGGATTFQFGRFFANEDATDVNSETKNITFTTGFNAKLSESWSMEAYYTFGESKLHVDNIGVVVNTKRIAAVDAVVNPANGQIVCNVTLTHPGLYPGCVPFNPFGPTAQAPGSSKYWRDTAFFDLTNRMDDFGGSVAGDVFQLPAGPLRAALSGEYRRLSLDNTSSASPTELADCTGLRFNCTQGTTTKWGNNITQDMSAKETVWEVAGEVTLPLLKDMPMVQALDMNGAYRYTDYSISGIARTWKVGLDWHVVDDVTLRATRSQDIRAPTLYDLFQPLSRTSAPFADIHTGVSQSAPNITRGNDTLVSEVAQTLTAGVVLRPRFLPRFSLSLDYFKIEIDNAISNVGGRNQTVIAQCENSGGTSPLCALYARPLPFSNRTAANFPTAIYSQPQNVSQTWTNGVDIEANYSIELSDWGGALPGRLDMRLFGTYQPKLASVTLPGQPVVNDGGTADAPEWRITANLGYTIGDFSVRTSTRWRNELKRSGDPTLFYADPPIPSVAFTDLTLTYKTQVWGGDSSVFLNVRNLFDKVPPVVAGGNGTPNGGNNIAQGDDIVGRYFAVGFRSKF
jgi:iron complex outermembrane receptor protein